MRAVVMKSKQRTQSSTAGFAILGSDCSIGWRVVDSQDCLDDDCGTVLLRRAVWHQFTVREQSSRKKIRVESWFEQWFTDAPRAISLCCGDQADLANQLIDLSLRHRVMTPLDRSGVLNPKITCVFNAGGVRLSKRVCEADSQSLMKE